MTQKVDTAVILAGGLGTRLRAAFSGPKVLAPVEGRPFIVHLLEKLEGAGIERVVVCTGYRADEVRSALGDRYGRLALVYSAEAQPLGTGGALRNALSMFESDPVLVLNGDSWCDFHLPALLAFHRARHAAGSIWLAGVADAARFGSVEVADNGEVRAFHEKARTASPWVSAGVYLLSRAMLESIGSAEAVSLEREVFPRWTSRGLFAYPGGRAFFDIGTPQTYAAAASTLASIRRRARLRRPGARHAALLDRDGTICVDRHYVTDPDAVELLPGAAAGLRKLRALGLDLVLLTNQSVIGRGDLTLAGLNRIHERLCELLRDEGASLDAIYFCPHRADEHCECRKPAPGMVLAAARDRDFDSCEGFVIGDNLCDLELSRTVGATSLLVTSGHGREVISQGGHDADYVVDDLADAADVIEHLLSLKQSSTAAAEKELFL